MRDERLRPLGARRIGRILGIAWIFAAPAVVVISVAPTSAADATANLKDAVESAHGGCPALQSNPVLNDMARRVNLSQDSYILFRARSQPVGAPKGDILPALHQLGYNADKAKTLFGYGDPEISGYGDVEAKAIYGAILEGYEALPDCTYKKYGVDVLANESKGYALATVILADA
jgi:hypothetical protein